MTEQRLREPIAEGESLTVEFKSEAKGPLSDDELVQEVVCLANRPEGELGWLLLGVEAAYIRQRGFSPQKPASLIEVLDR